MTESKYVSEWTATFYKLEYGREVKGKSAKFFASSFHTQRWHTTLAKRVLGFNTVESTTAVVSKDEFVIKMKSLGAFIECRRNARKDWWKDSEASQPSQLDEPGLVMGAGE